MRPAPQVLSKTMDSTTLTTDKVELATISRDEADGGRVGPAVFINVLEVPAPKAE